MGDAQIARGIKEAGAKKPDGIATCYGRRRRRGESVHAAVVRKPGQAVSEEELLDFCQSWIAGYKCPRSIGFQEEALPISGAGKILKNELRAPYWEGRSRRVN